MRYLPCLCGDSVTIVLFYPFIEAFWQFIEGYVDAKSIRRLRILFKADLLTDPSFLLQVLTKFLLQFHVLSLLIAEV
jgi:hypothetical protein